MKFATGIQILILAALAGIGLRNFEAGNYTTAGFAGMGIAALGVVAAIRVRNHFDKRAIQN
jgi:hypothetical protein